MNDNSISIHYSDIENLVETRQQKGTRLECVFACPVSGKRQKTTVDIVAANDSVATKVRSRLRGAAVRSITRGAGRTLRSLFGNNAVGKLACELASDKGKEVAAEGGFDEHELQRAVVVAFEGVAAQFVRSVAHGGFVHRSAVAVRDDTQA